MTNKVLIIAAHPDDEILGCGATAARMVAEGYEVYTLVLGEGITSRDNERDRLKREKELQTLRDQIYKANETIGVREVFIHDFPDNRFDTVALLDIVKVIEDVKEKVKPNIVFTHYEKDLNIDHQITYRAVITATRPLPDETVKEIYSFEILSSTEWSYPLSFSPDVYFAVADWLDKKKEAMKTYKLELRNYPHPRSIEGIKALAEYRGLQVGLKYAEAFKSVRVIR